jgi:hypothetical protein
MAIASSTPDVDQWTDRLYMILLDKGEFTEIAAPRGFCFGANSVSLPVGDRITRVRGPP